VQREDETEEVIRQRLEVYEEKTAPLLHYYQDSPYYISVPALKAPPVVEAIDSFISK
jgi:adenylate kinase